MAEVSTKRAAAAGGALTGAPVLLKQGYMQQKGMMGYKKRYFRLLQDSLFSFAAPDTKTPLDEISLSDGSVEDASWETKTGNALRVTTSDGKVHLLVCTNNTEHRQWFDALYYSTTLTLLAEYCSPLSGGWLDHYDKGRFVKRWFVIKDSFLLCYNSREDMNNPQDGHKTGRRFVLPLMGAMLAYHKTSQPYSFSIQMRQMGEIKAEFVFAAASEAVMNVWMETLYVSMGNTLPEEMYEATSDKAALDVQPRLEDLESVPTHVPSKSHHNFTKGTGVVIQKGTQSQRPAPAEAEAASQLPPPASPTGGGGVHFGEELGGRRGQEDAADGMPDASFAADRSQQDRPSAFTAAPSYETAAATLPAADEGGWGVGDTGMGMPTWGFGFGSSADKSKSESGGGGLFASWF